MNHSLPLTRLWRLLPRVLPTDPSEAVTGTAIVDRLEPWIRDCTSEQIDRMVRYLSTVSFSPIARYTGTHAFFLRPGHDEEAPAHLVRAYHR